MKDGSMNPWVPVIATFLIILIVLVAVFGLSVDV